MTIKKSDFLAELDKLKKQQKKIADMRAEANKLKRSSDEEEKTFNKNVFQTLADELRRNGIDPTDLKFIVEACIDAKLRRDEAAPAAEGEI